MYGYIYLTTNLVNGKKYIGKHKASKFDESYKGSGYLLNKAIKKYGWNSFKTEILQECDSEEDLNSAEVQIILENNAVESSDYYNLNQGGHGSFEYINSHRDTINMPVQDLRGEKNPNYGHRGYTLSEETRKKMSEVRKGKKQNPVGVLKRAELLRGGHLSEETKIKISQSQMNHKWVHKIDEFGNPIRVTVPEEKVSIYISQGFVLGQGPRKSCSKISSTTIESITDKKDIGE